jgi:hypothetical protein
MDNIVIVDDDSDNYEEVVTATAQILDGLPVDTSDNQAMTVQNINTNQINVNINTISNIILFVYLVDHYYGLGGRSNRESRRKSIFGII